MLRKGTCVIASVAVLGTGCGSTGNTASGNRRDGEVIVTFAAQNGSGMSGTAALTSAGDKTKVVIDLQDRSATAIAQPHPAHIHKGSCANLDPAPAYALNDVRDGKSTTTVDAKLAELTAGAFAINVHKSAHELGRYVSCGSFGKGNRVSLPGYSRESD